MLAIGEKKDWCPKCGAEKLTQAEYDFQHHSCGWNAMAVRPAPLSDALLCRLSQAFNEVADMRVSQNAEIHEWLKAEIVFSRQHA